MWKPRFRQRRTGLPKTGRWPAVRLKLSVLIPESSGLPRSPLPCDRDRLAAHQTPLVQTSLHFPLALAVRCDCVSELWSGEYGWKYESSLLGLIHVNFLARTSTSSLIFLTRYPGQPWKQCLKMEEPPLTWNLEVTPWNRHSSHP